MKCHAARPLLAARIAGDDLTPVEMRELDDHMAECPDCRAEARRLAELWADLGELEVPRAPSGARDRLMASLPRRSRSFWWSGRSAAAVAGLLLGIAMGWAGHGRFAAPVSPPARSASDASGRQPSFLLLLRETRARLAVDRTLGRDSVVTEYAAWAGTLARQGRLIRAEKLRMDNPEWVGENPDTLPPALGRGEISGFFLIRAANLDEAVGIASRSPHALYGGVVEVREVEPTGR